MTEPIKGLVRVQRGQRVDGFGESESAGWEIVGGDDVIADCNVEADAHRIAKALNVLARVESDHVLPEEITEWWGRNSIQAAANSAIQRYRAALLQEPEGEVPT